MMNLKEQLARAIGNMLVANIPTGDFKLDVESTYLTGEKIKCLECDSGEALLVTTHDVFNVAVKDGEVVELDAYMVMDPYEQAIWDTLHENSLLSKLYDRIDTDNDGVDDTIVKFNTDTNKYEPTPGPTYYKQEDIDELRKQGTLDPEAFTKLKPRGNVKFDETNVSTDSVLGTNYRVFDENAIPLDPLTEFRLNDAVETIMANLYPKFTKKA